MNTNFTITINDAETVRKIREQREAEELAAIAQSRLYVESVRAEAAAKAAAEAQTIEEAADAAHRAKIAKQNAAYALEDIRRAGNLEDIARAEQTGETISAAAEAAAAEAAAAETENVPPKTPSQKPQQKKHPGGHNK